MTSESAVNFANVSDDNHQGKEKQRKPVAERRQRRDLRKRVRIEDNTNNINENVIGAVEVPVIKMKWLKITLLIIQKINHVKNVSVVLHVIYVHRIINAVVVMKVKSPMPLFAAVASPELASGKGMYRLFCSECTTERK